MGCPQVRFEVRLTKLTAREFEESPPMRGGEGQGGQTCGAGGLASGCRSERGDGILS